VLSQGIFVSFLNFMAELKILIAKSVTSQKVRGKHKKAVL
jgi:hypothetical protein